MNIGTVGVSGSTTNVNIGSAVAGALGALTINSPTVTFGSSVSAIAMAAANVSALYLGLGGSAAAPEADCTVANDAANAASIRADALTQSRVGLDLCRLAGQPGSVARNRPTAATTKISK